jgi:hypothetical protein
VERAQCRSAAGTRADGGVVPARPWERSLRVAASSRRPPRSCAT